MILPGEIRNADIAVWTTAQTEDQGMPCALVEWSLKNGSFPEARQFCVSNFKLIPELRNVLLFRFYKRRVIEGSRTGPFGALAVRTCCMGANLLRQIMGL
jgi:hypothetical protein